VRRAFRCVICHTASQRAIGEGEVSVRDNGRGIGPPRKGGLGLRLAESLADQLGGRLITPAVPKGTLTILTFPYSV
jgi:two-component sensor histidine kinase